VRKCTISAKVDDLDFSYVKNKSPVNSIETFRSLKVWSDEMKRAEVKKAYDIRQRIVWSILYKADVERSQEVMLQLCTFLDEQSKRPEAVPDIDNIQTGVIGVTFCTPEVEACDLMQRVRVGDDIPAGDSHSGRAAPKGSE